MISIIIPQVFLYLFVPLLISSVCTIPALISVYLSKLLLYLPPAVAYLHSAFLTPGSCLDTAFAPDRLPTAPPLSYRGSRAKLQMRDVLGRARGPALGVRPLPEPPPCPRGSTLPIWRAARAGRAVPGGRPHPCTLC